MPYLGRVVWHSGCEVAFWMLAIWWWIRGQRLNNCTWCLYELALIIALLLSAKPRFSHDDVLRRRIFSSSPQYRYRLSLPTRRSSSVETHESTLFTFSTRLYPPPHIRHKHTKVSRLLHPARPSDPPEIRLDLQTLMPIVLSWNSKDATLADANLLGTRGMRGHRGT
jgi:hypothetical protein